MSRNAARQGFSLIELLVVLGILVILSSIGVAAFISSGKVNRLVATEQLISAQIRQARYTARATGQAVLIYIDKDANTISGVSRIPMWQGSCEAPFKTPTASAATADDQAPFDMDNNVSRLSREKFLAANGRTGTGFCRTSLATSGDVAAVTLFDPGNATGIDRNRQLTRSSTKPSEGFMLSCAVRPPRLTTTTETQPLLIIGPDTDGDTSKSYAGIILKAARLKMYNGSTPPSVAPAPPNGMPALSASDVNPERLCWDIRGWVMSEADPTNPIIISSITDAVTVGSPDQKFLADGDHGGRWEEIGLIYTGTSLELYRDGIQVARLTTGIPTRVAGNKGVHRLIIGSAVINGATPAKVIHPETIIDDIALFRLAADQPTQFAQGVQTTANTRLLVRPDGRMIEELSGNSGTIDLTFTGVFAEKEDQAIISITAGTGLVNSTKVKLSQSAP